MSKPLVFPLKVMIWTLYRAQPVVEPEELKLSSGVQTSSFLFLLVTHMNIFSFYNQLCYLDSHNMWELYVFSNTMDKATAACTDFLVIASLFSIIDRIILLEVVDYIFLNFIRQVVCVGSIDELELTFVNDKERKHWTKPSTSCEKSSQLCLQISCQRYKHCAWLRATSTSCARF